MRTTGLSWPRFSTSLHRDSTLLFFGFASEKKDDCQSYIEQKANHARTLLVTKTNTFHIIEQSRYWLVLFVQPSVVLQTRRNGWESPTSWFAGVDSVAIHSNKNTNVWPNVINIVVLYFGVPECAHVYDVNRGHIVQHHQWIEFRNQIEDSSVGKTCTKTNESCCEKVKVQTKEKGRGTKENPRFTP